MGGWDMGGWHMGGWSTGWMWLWGLLILSVLVALVVGLARGVGGGGVRRGSGTRSHAEELLAERFARGEISEDEYRTRRELLR